MLTKAIRRGHKNLRLFNAWLEVPETGLLSALGHSGRMAMLPYDLGI